MAAMSSSTPESPAAVKASQLPMLGMGLVMTLLLQLLVGIANALWLDVPATGNAWKTAAPGALLGAHMLVGTILAVFVVWVAVLAVREHDRAWVRASVIGIVGILLAFGGGTAFMSTNGSAAPSMVMAVGCTLAIAGYVVALAKR